MEKQPVAIQCPHAGEIDEGKRFAFGKNWAEYVTTLDDDRIEVAMQSLVTMTDVQNFAGKTVLDLGSGSGLFSLAFKRLGASAVVSVDYDPESVACTSFLRQKYGRDDESWRVYEGSVLDKDFMETLGQFDVVYSWGVLHHTGSMWEAVDNAADSVNDGGLFFIANCPDLGIKSKIWWKVKRMYCSSAIGRVLVLSAFVPYYVIRALIEDLLRLRNPTRRYLEYKKNRGMSQWYDWKDWLGGFPYEYATPDKLFKHNYRKGFKLVNMKTQGMIELVFRKNS